MSVPAPPGAARGPVHYYKHKHRTYFVATACPSARAFRLVMARSMATVREDEPRPLEVLVYCGEGAGYSSARNTLSAIRRCLAPGVEARFVDTPELLEGRWREHCLLLVMPGGADLPYCKHLNGRGNQLLRGYVEAGGSYLGICAGAYYACGRVEFEPGGELEVVGDRELAFFLGTARGAAYPGFDYMSEKGACAAPLRFRPPAVTTAVSQSAKRAVPAEIASTTTPATPLAAPEPTTSPRTSCDNGAPAAAAAAGAAAPQPVRASSPPGLQRHHLAFNNLACEHDGGASSSASVMATEPSPSAAASAAEVSPCVRQPAGAVVARPASAGALGRGGAAAGALGAPQPEHGRNGPTPRHNMEGTDGGGDRMHSHEAGCSQKGTETGAGTRSSSSSATAVASVTDASAWVGMAGLGGASDSPSPERAGAGGDGGGGGGTGGGGTGGGGGGEAGGSGPGTVPSALAAAETQLEGSTGSTRVGRTSLGSGTIPGNEGGGGGGGCSGSDGSDDWVFCRDYSNGGPIFEPWLRDTQTLGSNTSCAGAAIATPVSADTLGPEGPSARATGCGYPSYPAYDVLAVYPELGDSLAAVRCRVGLGVAVLCGTHPEMPYEALLGSVLLYDGAQACHVVALGKELAAWEKQRRQMWAALLLACCVGPTRAGGEEIAEEGTTTMLSRTHARMVGEAAMVPGAATAAPVASRV